MSSIDEALQNQLMDAAKASIRHAYMPYSHYPVGAAVLTADNQIIQPESDHCRRIIHADLYDHQSSSQHVGFDECFIH